MTRVRFMVEKQHQSFDLLQILLNETLDAGNKSLLLMSKKEIKPFADRA